MNLIKSGTVSTNVMVCDNEGTCQSYSPNCLCHSSGYIPIIVCTPLNVACFFNW